LSFSNLHNVRIRYPRNEIVSDTQPLPILESARIRGMKPILLFLLIGLLAAGCAPADSPGEPAAMPPAVGETATAAPPVVATATNLPAVAATPAAAASATAVATISDATAAPDAATEPAASAVVYGRTADGAFFHGAADAPVTLIDY